MMGLTDPLGRMAEYAANDNAESDFARLAADGIVPLHRPPRSREIAALERHRGARAPAIAALTEQPTFASMLNFFH